MSEEDDYREGVAKGIPMGYCEGCSHAYPLQHFEDVDPENTQGYICEECTLLKKREEDLTHLTYQCECCNLWLNEDLHPFDEEGWCKECAQAAKDTFNYRAWVNRGG